MVCVIEPEYIFSHPNYIWKTLGIVMIYQSFVESISDEVGYLRSHSALDVQLSYWERRFAMLAD